MLGPKFLRPRSETQGLSTSGREVASPHEATFLVETNFSDRSSGWILVVIIRVGATLLVLVLFPACERVMTRRPSDRARLPVCQTSANFSKNFSKSTLFRAHESGNYAELRLVLAVSRLGRLRADIRLRSTRRWCWRLWSGPNLAETLTTC